MIVNQANLHGLGVGFSTAFNMGFENTGTTWDKVATRVPSSTKEQEYAWLGSFRRCASGSVPGKSSS